MIKKIIKFAIVIISVVLLWKFFEGFVPELFLPKLSSIWETAKAMWKNGMLLNSAIGSFKRITIAALLAFIVSLVLSLLAFNFNMINNSIKPVISFMRFLPITAFYPLLIMWLGIDEGMKIAFLFFAILFSLLPSYLHTLNSVENRYLDTALTMGSKKLELTFLIIFPLVLPKLLQSFVTTYAVGWTYVIIAENINTVHGLGHIMNIGSARGRTDMVFVGLFTIIIISFLFDAICNLIIKKMFKWHFATIKSK